MLTKRPWVIIVDSGKEAGNMSLILESGLEHQLSSEPHNEVWFSCLIHCRPGFWGCTKASDANLSGHEISVLGTERLLAFINARENL